MPHLEPDVDLKSKQQPREPKNVTGNNPLPLVEILCQTLRARRIAYCHWKSNEALDRSASGQNDLDLLVSRTDAQRFAEALCALSFKRVVNNRRRDLPGIEHYFGFDHTADRFVHVHAHYQLVVGHDMSKNYHLPIEAEYLRSSVAGDLFDTPAPELELVVFVIRMTLKHSSWDSMLARQAALSPSERRELAYLEKRADRVKVHNALNQLFPFFEAGLFDRCLRSLDCRAGFWMRAKAASSLQKNLRVYARRPPAADLFLKLWRPFARAIRRRIFGRLSKLRFSGGGTLMAVVGGDGAGKSTAVDALHTWLSSHFEVHKVHLGKPEWSRTTVVIRAVLRVGTMLSLYPFSREEHSRHGGAVSPSSPDYPTLIRSVCTARDRFLTYLRARRLASDGGLVICDRFPLPSMLAMDGPRTERMTAGLASNRALRWLVRLEAGYYRRIARPDLLVVMKLDPDVAVRRKPEEDALFVMKRASQVWKLNKDDAPAYFVDASHSKTEVLGELKRFLWSNI